MIDTKKAEKAIAIFKNMWADMLDKAFADNPELRNDPMIGYWATAALADLLCASALTLGVKKDLLFQAVEESWVFIKEKSKSNFGKIDILN